MGRPSVPAARFARFAGVVVAYLLAVILFGAWVRVTGSGAGCGEDWPTCHGELVPRSASTQSIIEYTHRATSGLLGPLVLALLALAWRRFPARHPVRRFSAGTVALVAVEAAIGAGLVLRGLVAGDDSAARALVVALHLGNTLALMACAALTVAAARPSGPTAGPAPRRGGFTLLLVGLVAVSCSGAVTALGDTLLPAGSEAARALEGHFLVRLRIVHPALAALVATSGAAFGLAHRESVPVWPTAVASLCAAQLCVGIVNIALGAPGWLQLVHLLLAQLLWMSAVVWAFRTRASGRPAPAASARRLTGAQLSS